MIINGRGFHADTSEQVGGTGARGVQEVLGN